MKGRGILGPDIPLYPPDTEGRAPTLVFQSQGIGDETAKYVEDLLGSYKGLLYSLHGLRYHISIDLYPKLSQYLDAIERTGDINVGIQGVPFLHFLVSAYYMSIDEAESQSTLYYILDLVKMLHEKIGAFDINIQDWHGNTPLMRIFSYQRETREKTKNGTQGTILSSLGKFAYLVESLGGEVRLTDEQKIRLAGEEVLKEQSHSAQEIIYRLYVGGATNDSLYGDFSAKV